jgi:hypothetical protein
VLRSGDEVDLTIAVAPIHVGAPTKLSVDQSSASVTLSWKRPSVGSPVGRYVIFRDGREQGERARQHRTFFIDGLEPGSTHRYWVVAIGRTERKQGRPSLRVHSRHLLHSPLLPFLPFHRPLQCPPDSV